MNGTGVTGRGITAGVWTATAGGTGVTVRVEDWGDSEVWVDLRLTVADLEEMLARCRAADPPGCGDSPEAA